MKKPIVAIILLLLGMAVIREFLEVRRLEADQTRWSPQPSFHELKASSPKSQPRTDSSDATSSAKADMRELELNRDSHPHFISFTPTGELATRATERLGLDEQETAKANEAFAKIRDASKEDFLTRIKPLPPNPRGNAVFYARARRDRGKALFKALSKDLEEAIGRDRATIIMGAFSTSDFLGDMGVRDTEFELISTEEGQRRLKYRLLNPKTGNPTRLGETPLEKFEEQFGIEWDFDRDD